MNSITTTVCKVISTELHVWCLRPASDRALQSIFHRLSTVELDIQEQGEILLGVICDLIILKTMEW